jgi:hypothetical protein
MSVLEIVLAVIAALVLLTFVWGARSPQSRSRTRDDVRGRRNREDLL